MGSGNVQASRWNPSNTSRYPLDFARNFHIDFKFYLKKKIVLIIMPWSKMVASIMRKIVRTPSPWQLGRGRYVM